MSGSSVNKQGFESAMDLETRQYMLGADALAPAVGYLSGERNRLAAGGEALGQPEKADALRSIAFQGMGGPLQGGGAFGQGGIGTSAARGADVLSGIGNQRIGSSLDEMNKIRSMLASQGLKTTNLGAESGMLGLQAARMLPQRNPWVSTAFGLAAAGAAAYGAEAFGGQGGGTGWGSPLASNVTPNTGQGWWSGDGGGGVPSWGTGGSTPPWGG